MPKPYEFNAEIGMDLMEVKDAAGTYFDILNCVDYGTHFEQAFVVSEAETNGVPSSAKRLEALVSGWVRPFGWPQRVAVDRGAHNRGMFNQTLTKNGVRFNPDCLESPEQIGRVERRNQTLKHLMAKAIKETNAIGRQAMDMVLAELICAINEMSRHGGFALRSSRACLFEGQPRETRDNCQQQPMINSHPRGTEEPPAASARLRVSFVTAAVWKATSSPNTSCNQTNRPSPTPFCQLEWRRGGVKWRCVGEGNEPLAGR